MIHYLRVHPGWAWPLGSLVMAGVLWCAWRVGKWWADRTEPAEPRPAWLPELEPAGSEHWTPDQWNRYDLGLDPYQDEDGWAELDAEEQADQLIHEWHDDPPEDVTQPWNLWDQWWADMDSLERECWRVRVTCEDSDRMWDELKAETRALCPLAA